MQEDPVQFLGREDMLEKRKATHSRILWASLVAQLGRPGFDSWVGKRPWKRGKLLQYSFLEHLHGQRNLVGSSPWGHKELDTTE